MKINSKQGISLIALIITIIVIVILAAIVVTSSLNTPERANWARFTSDYTNMKEAISIKEAELYGKYATGEKVTDDGRIPTRAEIYEEIATGNLPEAGLVNDINEIKFTDNSNLNIGTPGYNGKWFLSSDGKLNYEGYVYDNKVWTTPTEEGQITSEMVISNGSFNLTAEVNSPKLVAGMIPIYYDNGKWRKADATNAENKWYNYKGFQYANICTVSDAINAEYGYREAEINKEIPIAHMTTMFVWIPRYAYSINTGSYKVQNTETVTATNANTNKKINVVFLVGTTNQDKEGVTYTKDYDASSIAPREATPKIVHPGFTFGGRELSGLWIAKFEASGREKVNGVVGYVGNASESSENPQYPATATTAVEILPGAKSWRHITTGEAQYQSMRMGSNKTAYGWSNVNTHLIKNIEWGAAAYLSYSQYGKVPMINGSGKIADWCYDFYTGAGPGATNNETAYESYSDSSHGYNTALGKLASTTGNVYGIYDMSAGAPETVAVYVGPNNIDGDTIYTTREEGSSTSNSSVTYFDNGKLKEEYEAYFEIYGLKDDGKSDIPDRKGIGYGEMIETFPYLGNGGLGTAYVWNRDYVRPWLYYFASRGGIGQAGINSGIFRMEFGGMCDSSFRFPSSTCSVEENFKSSQEYIK